MKAVTRLDRQRRQLHQAGEQLRASGALLNEAPRPWQPWRTHGSAIEAAATRGGKMQRIAQRGFLAGVTEVWENGWYVVMVRPLATTWGPVTHLLISNLPDLPVRSWADLMRIKDEIIGAERTAIEVYPPRDEVMDQAHMTHLWVLPPDMVLPFSLNIQTEAK